MRREDGRAPLQPVLTTADIRGRPPPNGRRLPVRLYSDTAERRRLTESFLVAWQSWRTFLPLVALVTVVFGLQYGWLTAIPPLLALATAAALSARLHDRHAGEAIALAAITCHLLILSLIVLAGSAHTRYLLALDAIPVALGALALPRRIVWPGLAAALASLIVTAIAIAPHAMLAIPAYWIVPAIFIALTVINLLSIRDQNLVNRDTAVVDPLTGQLGRLALQSRIDEMDAAGTRRATIAVVDVDHFKAVNDRHGHATGDRVLAETARRMAHTLGDHGTLYRFGGDEFVILLQGGDKPPGHVLERLRTAVNATPIEGCEISLSIGLAQGEQLRTGGHDELFRRADAALCSAKRQGRDRIVAAGSDVPAERRRPSLRRGPRPAGQPAPMPAPPRIPSARRAVPTAHETEREHQRSMVRLAYRHSLATAVLAPLAAIVRGFWFGWWHPVPIIAGGIVLRPLMRTWYRARNPALVAIAVSLLSNVLTPISQVLATSPAFFALPMIALTGLSASASLGRRGGLIIWTGASLCVPASVLLVQPAAITDPGVVLVPWLLITFSHLLGHRTGRAMLATRREVLVDPLTGVLNRLALDARIPAFEFGAGRHEGGSSVLVCDLDNFKSINDTYGHAFGDQALRAVATALCSALRPADGLYRIGGDEFVVLLDATGADAAHTLAERIRRVVAATPLGAIPVTISIGTATHAGEYRCDYRRLFERADAALYEAKRSGRNRVVTGEREPARPAAA